MTLVLSASISGRFVMMTSDTRRVWVKNKYDFEAGEMERDENPVADEEVRDIKAHVLNGKILFGAGGDSELADYLRNAMEEEIKDNHDISDCKRILEGILKESQKEVPGYFNLLNIKDSVSVSMMGFYADGSTGAVIFNSGRDAKVKEHKAPKDTYHSHVIAPAKEYLNRSSEMLAIPELYEEKTYEGMTAAEVYGTSFQKVLDKLVMVNWAVSYNHPVQVSPDFEVNIISCKMEDDGTPTFKHHKTKYDHSLSQKLFRENQKAI
jgi:hypothetical protein